MNYRKLKDIDVLNLSALGRAAKIKNNRLVQAVGGYPVSAGKPGSARKLSEPEQLRLRDAIMLSAKQMLTICGYDLTVE